jgi:hypothetical protein
MLRLELVEFCFFMLCQGMSFGAINPSICTLWVMPFCTKIYEIHLEVWIVGNSRTYETFINDGYWWLAFQIAT